MLGSEGNIKKKFGGRRGGDSIRTTKDAEVVSKQGNENMIGIKCIKKTNELKKCELW